MKCNKIKEIVQKTLHDLYVQYPMIYDIISAINDQGGRAYYVGGMVRDMFLGLSIKDIDIEVHGLSQEALASILTSFGRVDYVGKAFGVFKLSCLPVDWSMPRSDTSGRKPVVTINEHMDLKQALRRRDLTINAMAIDACNQELIDPFNGYTDLQHNILRATDVSFFTQDPLRFFRVMQFVSRFNMFPDNQLQVLCKQMDIAHVSRERIEQEFCKMLLRSHAPSLGIRWLASIGRLHEVLPELAATIGVKQDIRWHPEGDVFEHSMQALDAAADLSCNDDDNSRLIILYAALCHDLGKVTTTFKDAKGIHSYGHAQEGVAYARIMLQRLTHNQALLHAVCGLVRWHMSPGELTKAKPLAYKRLAYRLSYYNVTMAMLAQIAYADRRGRNVHSTQPLQVDIPEIDYFVKRAQDAGVFYEPEAPLLTGKDFINELTPGPIIGLALKKAYEKQIEGVTDKAALKKMVLKGLSSIRKSVKHH